MSRLKMREHLKSLEEKRRELTEKIRETKKKIGSVEGPMQSWSSHLKQDLEDEALILKESLEKVEAQIKELSGLARPKEIGPIVVGSQVRLSLDGEEKEFLITEEQSDPVKGFLSARTPLGKAVLGQKKGKGFTVELPGGEVLLEVLEVS